MTDRSTIPRIRVTALLAAAFLGACDDGQKDEREVQAMQLHGGAVTAVAFSPDGDVLASAGEDDAMRLLDISDVKDASGGADFVALPGELPGSPIVGVGSGFFSLAFTGGGARVAGGNWRPGTGGFVGVWSVDGDGQGGLEMGGYGAPVRAIAVSPDGARLAAGSGNPFEPGEVGMWDEATGKRIGTFGEGLGSVHALAFSPDGALLAAATQDGAVHVWRSAGGVEILALREDEDVPYAVVFSPDGRFLFSAGVSAVGFAGGSGVVRMWGSSGGDLYASFGVSDLPIRSLALSPDGSVLAAGGDDNRVELLDLGASTLLDTLKGHAGPVTSVAFAPNGRLIATGSRDGSVRLWYAGDLAGHPWPGEDAGEDAGADGGSEDAGKDAGGD
jgi:WD40 repeat protein